ncbi:MAG: cytochrome c [Nitrospinota bacterium]|nr:MAG: cytochrome c [Nitrospinota bacterium]
MMMRWSFLVLFLGGVLLLGLVVTASMVGRQVQAAQPDGALTPPFNLEDETVIEEGARLFRQNCTFYCHGKEGRQARAPSLRGQQYTPDYLFNKIYNGARAMPAFKLRLSQEKIWKLVAYILSLANEKEN